MEVNESENYTESTAAFALFWGYVALVIIIYCSLMLSYTLSKKGR